MVYKFLKALYGLKQSPRFQYKRLANFFFKKLGLKQMNANHNIFVIKASPDGPVVSTFVNDIKIMTSKNGRIIRQVQLELTFAFFMIEIGSISFYLGLKVQRDSENKLIKLSQPVYINKVLNNFNFDKTYTINIIMKKTALFK